jgi:hypothetical protein
VTPYAGPFQPLVLLCCAQDFVVNPSLSRLDLARQLLASVAALASDVAVVRLRDLHDPDRAGLPNCWCDVQRGRRTPSWGNVLRCPAAARRCTSPAHTYLVAVLSCSNRECAAGFSRFTLPCNRKSACGCDDHAREEFVSVGYAPPRRVLHTTAPPRRSTHHTPLNRPP